MKARNSSLRKCSLIVVVFFTLSLTHQQNDEYSVILIPDTQHYTMDAPDTTYSHQMRWIRDHQTSENILFAIHLGDITQDHEQHPKQWSVANSAHRILDDANVPYSVLPGNHDYPTGGESVLRRPLLYYNWFFGPGRFAGRSWYGGHFPSGAALNENNVTFFGEGHQQFSVLSLEFAPRKDALCWADSVLAAHPERRAIIATHCYIGNNGRVECGTGSSYNMVGANGKTIWDELIRRHSSIGLVVAGHVDGARYYRRYRTSGALESDDNQEGDLVTEILTDYQSEPFRGNGDPKLGAGDKHGNGWLRQLRFSPRENRLFASVRGTRTDVSRFFLPSYDSDSIASPHKFDVWFDLSPWTSARYSFTRQSNDFFDRTINDRSKRDEIRPAISMAESGDFVVAWQDDSDGDPGVYQIRARGFHPHGCERLPGRTVNSLASGTQNNPAIALAPEGGYVIVWEDDANNNHYYEIRARGFNADGSERFGDITVNTSPTRQQRAPAIAVDHDGNFVVAWEDDAHGAVGVYNIYARGFHADGTERFSARRVNQNAASQQLDPSIAMSGFGDFVVAWEDDATAPYGVYNIYARAYHGDGNPIGSQFRINKDASGQQRNPALAMGEGGQFLAVWEDHRQNSTWDVRVRGLDLQGAEWFADQRVSSVARGSQRSPAIAFGGQGRFYVAWEDDRDGNGAYQIHGRSVAGNALTEDFTVNSNSRGQQRRPEVAASAGVVVVVWEDDLDMNGAWQILGRGLRPACFQSPSGEDCP
jgi:hypothetical protein